MNELIQALTMIQQQTDAYANDVGQTLQAITETYPNLDFSYLAELIQGLQAEAANLLQAAQQQEQPQTPAETVNAGAVAT